MTGGTKAWASSLTIRGAAAVAVGLVASLVGVAVSPEEINGVVDLVTELAPLVVQLVGLVAVVIGRRRANTPLR